MIYSKRLSPHIHEFIMLGEGSTHEGRRYAVDNTRIIHNEFIELSKIESHRVILGGDKNIHMPELNHNPPTPFFG